MSSWATNAVEDLQGKIQAVTAIKKKMIYIHSQEQILDFTKKVKTPCVGILYNGLASKNEAGVGGTGHERDVDVSCNLVLLGGEVCASDVGDVKETATEIMDEIRNAIVTTEGATELRWRFLSETPLQLRYADGTSLFGYVQKWVTTMIQGED